MDMVSIDTSDPQKTHEPTPRFHNVQEQAAELMLYSTGRGQNLDDGILGRRAGRYFESLSNAQVLDASTEA